MSQPNGLLDEMMDQAMKEVACGEKGWKDLDPNTLTLACFGYLSKQIVESVRKPFWVFASVVGVGIVWSISADIFGI